jgi:hypothetical protein
MLWNLPRIHKNDYSGYLVQRVKFLKAESIYFMLKNGENPRISKN